MSNMIRLLTVLAATALLAACGRAGGDQPPLGQYRAVMNVAGGDLPFGLELAEEDGELVAWLVNGPERVRVPGVDADDGLLRMRMPGYQHRLEARWADGRFEGSVTFARPGGETRVARVVAMPGQPFRFFPPPPVAPQDFSGRWALTFRDRDGKERQAIAELEQRGHEVWGTVLRTTGDDRYIAGEARGDTLFLSRFDGGSAYLYLARLGPDGTLSGEFHTGPGAFETWAGRRDASAALPDPAALATMRADAGTVGFTFPDLDGRPVSYPGPRWQDKVVIITIGGSWCPNCHDEAEFLRDLLDARRGRGLEVIQLMFEYTDDFMAASSAARAFAQKFDIDYPVLVAGSTESGQVLQKLPQLGNFLAYPTMLVIDRKGAVRHVHTGFLGPATGEHFERQNRELTELVDGLLAEEA